MVLGAAAYSITCKTGLRLAQAKEVVPDGIKMAMRALTEGPKQVRKIRLAPQTICRLNFDETGLE